MTLGADGLWAALRWLNDRVPYRFTAIFAFDGDMLRNICLIDKENQSTTKCSDQPITESYCLTYVAPASVSVWREASLDKRVALHPKRQVFSATTAFHCLTRKENRRHGVSLR
jgi:hypothetical protein